ncbi:MAG: hypothetical protein LBG28_09565 [Tannerella sp.]|jgi:S-DNA-T family DNA segregation ATPase FtsK/SpoIIIE|nr:hypothetical protein [Tannerella sp.]
MAEQNDSRRRIRKTLEDFGINIISIKAAVGPTVTLYEVVPDKDGWIAKIKNLRIFLCKLKVCHDVCV